MIYLTLYILVNACLFLKVKEELIKYVYNDPEHYFMEDFVYSLGILIMLSLGSVLYITAKTMKFIKWLKNKS